MILAAEGSDFDDGDDDDDGDGDGWFLSAVACLSGPGV